MHYEEQYEQDFGELLEQSAKQQELENMNDDLMLVCDQLGALCELEERIMQTVVWDDEIKESINHTKLVLRGKAIRHMDEYYGIE